MLVIMSDAEREFTCQDVGKLVKEAQVQIVKAKKWKSLYYNMRRRELEIKMDDFV